MRKRSQLTAKSLAISIASIMAASTAAIAGIPTAFAATADIPLDDSAAVLAAVAPAVTATTEEPLDDQPEAIVDSIGTNTVISPSAPVDAVDSISITAQDISGETSVEGGVAAVVADSAKEALYVQPTEDGVRLMSVISDASAATAWDYAFTSSDGTPLIPELTEEGAALFRNGAGELVGTLAVPWAYDARQIQVPTKFEIHEGILTQSLDLTSTGIQFPVVADPNWTYSVTFMIGTTTVARIWSELNECFNCNFPLTGAPHDFPRRGDVLPLTMGGLGNFTVRTMDYWYIPTRSNTGFYLQAMPGHVDGFGSNIVFDIYLRPDGKYVMNVSAYIIRDFPLGNGTYVQFATATWNQFAVNLRNNTGAWV